MTHLITFLSTFIEPFRFLKHRRERLATEAHYLRMERERERAHQLELMEAVFTRIEATNKVTMDAIVEMARGAQEQAKSFSTWLEMFKAAQGEVPTSHTVRDEDEWLAEQQKLKAQGYPVDLPPEFHLAAILKAMDEESE